ncbi:CHC2 zinc finger domain-containing protein [Methylococcus sp. ANG]|uniref:CHC2 zinc finger domain-containing protein n=1 Tax=Methylococcus sp. ANG TaxID=3231903 RepID=UPI0034582827
MPTPRRESAWVDGGLCPFHTDTRPGSFRVNLATGAFCCFACGSKGADVIAFTQQHYSLSFPDAVRKLSNEWGIA